MSKQVLNTVLLKASATDDAGRPSVGKKHIFWGTVSDPDAITGSIVMGLGFKEARDDRFKVIPDFDSAGEHMTFALLVAYGGSGNALDQATQFTYPFELKASVQVTDPNNNIYTVNVYVWQRKSYGVIANLQIL